MSLNQYAVYQLKPDAEIRPYRYKTYQQLMDSHLTVRADHYHQVFLTTMVKETAPKEIRRRLETKLPPQFLGNALNVSDVIAITREGISTAYYVDKAGFVVLPGFFRLNSSAALITMETTGFIFNDRKGSWMATDETIVDGKQFFLMASEAYGNKAAFAVVDDQGKRAAEDTLHGFDDETIRQIREYLHPREPEQVQDASRTPEGKPKQEIWQKYFENGEYLRSVESGTEDNYNMIDGIRNNRRKQAKEQEVQDSEKSPSGQHEMNVKEPGKRVSVLQRLREKQAEVAVRYGKIAPEQSRNDVDMERNRK